MGKRITTAEATEMAQFFLSKKYAGTISEFRVHTEAGGSKAIATCKMDCKMWNQHFKLEVVMDAVYNTIEAREYHHEDNLSFYRNPDLQ